MKKSQKSVASIIKIDVGVYPAVSSRKACGFVSHYRGVILNTARVDTLVKLPAKKIDAHDTKNKPEYQAHEKNIGDPGYGVKQRADHHLKNKAKGLINSTARIACSKQ